MEREQETLSLQTGSCIALSNLASERQWHPIPVLLPGNSRGLRSPVGYSSWGRKESDTTERLRFTLGLHRLLSFVVKILATSVRGDDA